MTYEIEARTEQRRPTAVIVSRSAPEGLGEMFAECLPEVWKALEAAGISPAAPAPFGRYLSMEGGVFEMEAGFIVGSAVEPSGRVVPSELPAREVAVTDHVGPYQRLGEAHGALAEWARANGREPAGPAWEIFWTDPGAEPDPEKWRTEVFQPIR